MFISSNVYKNNKSFITLKFDSVTNQIWANLNIAPEKLCKLNNLSLFDYKNLSVEGRIPKFQSFGNLNADGKQATISKSPNDLQKSSYRRFKKKFSKLSFSQIILFL